MAADRAIGRYSRTHMDVDRRRFLKAAGGAAACVAAGPYVSGARRQRPGKPDEGVVGEADERIRRYRKGTATLRCVGPDRQPLPAGVSLQIRQKRHKFLFGCNIFKLGRCRTPEHNAAYEKHFAELLNYATLPFYWWMYERRKGQPQDERTEEIVRWCSAREIVTKGHPLAWNWGEPRWLSGTPEEAMQLQLKRIERCVERFKGGIDIWDVVNEATHYDRDHAKQNAPRLTQAISRMGVGEYVRTAFQIARRANPHATLVINDYRVDPDYDEKVISQLVGENGEPLYDVIGIQSHMHGGYWGAARAWEVCERFARFGKPLHFTETTLVSGPRKRSTWATTPEGEQQQAELTTQFYTVLFSHPAVEALTWWDFSDQNAWQGAPAGFLRDDMTPKPVYDQLHRLIKDRWWTRAEGRTNSGGTVVFDGFLGSHEITAKLDGRERTGTFALDRSSDAPLEVRLA